MATFTICYSGTDCYLDHGLVLRKPRELESYNPYSGYIPSKIHFRLSQALGPRDLPNSTTLNGCGGPYNENCSDLPIRIWSKRTEVNDTVTGEMESFWVCTKAPGSGLSVIDTASGNSVEWIAIAGIAQMLDITLQLVPAGQLDTLFAEWPTTQNMNYTQEDLAYPETNYRWNNTRQSEAGHYCLRWSARDNEKIQAFMQSFNTVVLLGHSRGGVACLIAANYLAEWFPAFTLKIAALDPVPGTGDWWPCITNIPATLNMEYVGIYAIDETSAGFNAVVPQVKGIDNVTNTIKRWDPLSPTSNGAGFQNWDVSRYQLIYTRGRHATVPGSNSLFGQGECDPSDPDVGSSGNLACAYVVKRLAEWGVPIVQVDSASVQTWITQMNNASAKFETMRNYNYGALGFRQTGWFNGIFYYKARGISSTSGRGLGSWNYLEAFITPPAPGAGQTVETVNRQRGLINPGIRESYYPEFGGQHTVQAWSYLGDVLQNYAPLNRL